MADVNGDGIPDVVASLGNGFTGGGSVTVMLGKGDGTFKVGPSSNLVLGDNTNVPGAAAVGDFNGDGIPDLVLTSVYSYPSPNYTDDVNILIGKGDGTFTTKSTFKFPGGLAVGAVADFNNDGIADVEVVTNSYYGATPTTLVLLGKGDGTFPTQWTLNIPPPVIMADLNGDGVLDALVTNGPFSANQTSCAAGRPDYVDQGVGQRCDRARRRHSPCLCQHDGGRQSRREHVTDNLGGSGHEDQNGDGVECISRHNCDAWDDGAVHRDHDSR